MNTSTITNLNEIQATVVDAHTNNGAIHKNENFSDRIVTELEQMSIAQLSANAPVENVPAGDYLVTITNGRLKEQADGSYYLVTVDMTISTGAAKGFSLTKYYHLKSQKAVDFFKKEMLVLGHVASGIEGLSDLCDSLAQTNAIATVVFNESGNRIIYLKAASIPKKVPPVKTEFAW